MKRLHLCLLVATSVILPPAVSAGKFQLQEVKMVKNESGSGVLVSVGASAVYRGRVKTSETDFFYLWTFMNRDQDGSDDLNRVVEWTFNEDLPDEFGEKLVRPKSELANGYIIACQPTDFCAATITVPYCAEDSEDAVGVRYQGAVGIYRGSGTVVGVNELEDHDFTTEDETACGHTVGGVVENLEDDQSVTIEGTFRLPNSDPTTQTVTVTHDKGRFTGEFEFPAEIRAYSTYHVEVTSHPANGMRCSVEPSTSSGTVSSQDVDDIRIVCSYTCRAGNDPVTMTGNYNVLFPDSSCTAIDDPQHCSAPEFTRSDSGLTVMDHANNLLWTWDVVTAERLTKSAARDLCRGLVFDGRSDWRLPDISQLRTLLPDCGGALANCAIGLDGTAADFWSSSGLLTPDDCTSSGICARCEGAASYACGWRAQFTTGEVRSLCGDRVSFLENRYGALVRCVTDLAP